MAFGGFSRGKAVTPVAEINMIPLIDVMLVLLVIFIITAPLLTHAVKLDLPRASSHPNLTRPDHITVSVDLAGGFFWNGERVTRADLDERLAAAAKQDPQPELHLRADRATRYEYVAEAMSDAARLGLARIGFVSDPEAGAR
jgi:biopolymer transport protein ExbD